MKKIMSLLCVVVALLGLTACDKADGFFAAKKECPVSVTVGNELDRIASSAFNQPAYLHYVLAKSMVDEITINYIVVNRGNCEPLTKAEFPVKLKFGEQRGISISRQCSVSEVSVGTSNGNWKFEFNE